MDVPRSITVAKVLTSRYVNLEDNFYNNLKRPLGWDERVSGREEIETVDGERIVLDSQGQQPTPEAGWTLILRSGNNDQGYAWTLYGMKQL